MIEKTDNIFGKVLVIITTGLTLLFTMIMLYSYITTETPSIIEGKVVPIVYSKTIIYFPASGPLFAESLADYLDKNNLQVMGMAGKNTIWTKGYIVAIAPRQSKCTENNDKNEVYIQTDNVIIIPESKKK